MSTASEDHSSEQPQRTSHEPGPLAILAATALGGVIAARMGKAPLLFAAGAAAMAMLKQKKTAAPPPPATPKSLPPPAPLAPEIPVDSQVEQWLSRQIIREEQAPVIDFSAAEITPEEPEEDYQPESFLLDEFEGFPSSSPPDNDSFADLTEPAQPIPAPAPEIEEAVEAEQEPEAPPPPPLFFQEAPTLQLLQQTPPPPVPAEVLLHTPPPPSLPLAADGAWTLGLDPLPSLNESAPYVPPVGDMFFSTPVLQEAPKSSLEPARSHMFSSAPVQHEEPGPPLFFSTAVFQGAAFPDEIQLAPPFTPVPPMPSPAPSVAAHVWEPAPFFEPLPTAAVAAAPEIPVELAAPGEASFDPPLAAAPHNPWQPEPDVFATTPAVPFQPQTAGTVVEAEIILRPRAPMQNSVTAKSKFAPQNFAKPFSNEDSAAPPAENANDAHFPGPLQSQHDPKPRPTWRSWWRGD
ncbi:MAG: hypothetical protein WAW39_30370 [Prosthecobacter sp.]|uniref:hypothetical protein n=1 Tax=Prosthecobacter sp. TaxID=1965333 RepID=UPI003BAE21E7